MKRILPVLALLIALGGGYAWYTLETHDTSGVWQGWVEADTLFIGPETTGRLASLSLHRGDKVTAGAPLFASESDEAQAQVKAAEALVSQARAQLAAAKAPRERPEEVEVLLAQEKAARASLEAARLEFERAKTLTTKGTAATAVLDQARAAFDRDTAQLEQIRNQIAVARLPARAPDLEKAQQAVSEAEANLERIRRQASKLVVTAPADGTVQEIYYRAGEVVNAGRPVVALLPPDALKIRFFVPEATIPTLKTGDRVTITCDGCAPTSATIDFIADKAEYTPPVIYSLEERAKLVFRIEATPLRPETLRVGQPVTVQRQGGAGS